MTSLDIIFRFLSDVSATDNDLLYRRQDKDTLKEKKAQLVKDLSESDIDPLLFDVLISNEIDRKLKVKFGVAFLVLSVLFTIASYLIVVLNSTQHWGISNIAITALIIETPIQFIGLLYIIARNLFPQSERGVKRWRSERASAGLEGQPDISKTDVVDGDSSSG